MPQGLSVILRKVGPLKLEGLIVFKINHRFLFASLASIAVSLTLGSSLPIFAQGGGGGGSGGGGGGGGGAGGGGAGGGSSGGGAGGGSMGSSSSSSMGSSSGGAGASSGGTSILGGGAGSSGGSSSNTTSSTNFLTPTYSKSSIRRQAEPNDQHQSHGKRVGHDFVRFFSRRVRLAVLWRRYVVGDIVHSRLDDRCGFVRQPQQLIHDHESSGHDSGALHDHHRVYRRAPGACFRCPVRANGADAVGVGPAQCGRTLVGCTKPVCHPSCLWRPRDCTSRPSCERKEARLVENMIRLTPGVHSVQNNLEFQGKSLARQ